MNEMVALWFMVWNMLRKATVLDRSSKITGHCGVENIQAWRHGLLGTTNQDKAFIDI